jgi:hypothetical protein
MIAYTEKRIDLRRFWDGDKKSSPRAPARQDPLDAAHVSTNRVLIDGGNRHMHSGRTHRLIAMPFAISSISNVMVNTVLASHMSGHAPSLPRNLYLDAPPSLPIFIATRAAVFRSLFPQDGPILKWWLERPDH